MKDDSWVVNKILKNNEKNVERADIWALKWKGEGEKRRWFVLTNNKKKK